MHKWRLKENEHTLLYEPQGNLIVNNFGAAKQATLMSAGISCLGNWMFREELQEGTVVPVLSEYWGEPIRVWVYYSSREYLPTRVRLLIDYLLEQVS
jgi:DNA-binding transcriptional LysR family regulator